MYLPLSRGWSRRVAVALIVAGVVLAPDIIIPTGTDFLNFLIAMPLADLLGVQYPVALMYTFLAAFLMLAAGFLIYPYNTKRLVFGHFRKAARFALKNPLYLLMGFVAFFIIFAAFSYAYQTVWQYARAAIGL